VDGSSHGCQIRLPEWRFERREVYVVQSSGFVEKGQEHKVYKLRKSLYDPRQAPRAWNIKLDGTLKRLGFTQSSLEHGLYARELRTQD
jgi:hypothetical protein